MNKKVISIEFIRVFAIILTIMIHVSNVYIYSFGKITDLDFFVSILYNSFSRICVPLFFMVSGIFLIREEFDKKKYIGRVKKFILLLIVWSIIYYLLYNYANIGDTLLSSIVNSLFNANMTSRHLWFMYAIIGIYLVLPFIQNMCKNMSKQLENLFLILWISFSGLVVVFVPLARFLTNSDIDISYPIPIINAAYYLGYFISGYILYNRFKNIKADKRKNIICIAIYIMSTICTAFLTYFISKINNSVYDSFMWYRSIFIILSSFSMFVLVIINSNRIKNENILKLSKYSFGVYLIHVIFLYIIKSNITIINYSPIIFIPIISIVIYVGSLFSCFMLKKIPILKNLI